MQKNFRKELESLNQKIDAKIVRGRSYVREARRHKFLLSKLYKLDRPSPFGWLSKSFGFISALVL